MHWRSITIRTRFHGPTNSKGSRLSARCSLCHREAERIYVPYNYALSLGENHKIAARQFIAKLGLREFDFAGGCFNSDYYWSPIIRENFQQPHINELSTVISANNADEVQL